MEDLVDFREVDNGMKGELNWSRFMSYGGFEIINLLLPFVCFPRVTTHCGCIFTAR
jgi:hypothetical protein